MSTPSPWTARDVPDLRGKTAIVTGANSGIGFETTRVLAGRGARVILACRSIEKGERALDRIRDEHSNAAATVARLDLADLASVRAFAEQITSEQNRLDLLVNNAGVMMCPRGETADGFERQFGTNHLGHFALTGLLTGRLRHTPGARVVTVSSSFHERGRIDFDDLQGERAYDPKTAYYQSKLANLLFVFELQRRLEASGADVLSVAAHPGYAATNLQRHVFLFRLTNPFLAQSAADGALPVLYAAAAADVEGGAYVGPSRWGGMKGPPERAKPSARSQNEDVARRLWDVSEQLTGVRFDL